MKRLTVWLVAVMVAAGIGGLSSTVMAPTVAFADAKCDNYILTIPPWYKGLTNSDCSISDPSAFPGGVQAFIWAIVLNVVEIFLNLVAYLTVGFIIYGGFKYILAAGAPESIKKAKTTITNAVIGLVLSIASIAIVNLIAGAIR